MIVCLEEIYANEIKWKPFSWYLLSSYAELLLLSELMSNQYWLEMTLFWFKWDLTTWHNIRFCTGKADVWGPSQIAMSIQLELNLNDLDSFDSHFASRGYGGGRKSNKEGFGVLEKLKINRKQVKNHRELMKSIKYGRKTTE